MEYIDICERCPYKDGHHLAIKYKNIARGIKPINNEINNSDTLLVFQSPGCVEWIAGAPLQNLNADSARFRIGKSWKRKGIRREDFDIANVVLCYQDKNSDGYDADMDLKAVDLCSNRLKDLIKSKQYKRAIAFGSHAKRKLKEIKKTLNLDIILEECNHPCARGKYRPSEEELDRLW